MNSPRPRHPPFKNKGPELGADNLTLEGVATELAPSDFVSQNYETLVALIQEETKKRSNQSLQARLNFGPEDEVSPPRHRKERRYLAYGTKHRPPVFTVEIGRKVWVECAKTLSSIARVKQRQGESTSAFVDRYNGRMHTRFHINLCDELLNNSQMVLNSRRSDARTAEKGLKQQVSGASPGASNDQSSLVAKKQYREGSIYSQTTTLCALRRATPLIDKLVKEGRLDHLVKNIKEGKDKQRSGGKKDAPRDKADTIYMWWSTYIEINAAVTTINDLYIDGGAFAEILYEHCSKDCALNKSQLNGHESLMDFTGSKEYGLLGHTTITVMVGNKEHSTTAWMNFMVIRSPSPYNGQYWKTRDYRRLSAVPSGPRDD
ncbi:hypothetical protein Tco_0488524 [Tanacetum coccineum]